MKAKERLSRIKRAGFGERLMLSADRIPGSKFDSEIFAAIHYSPTCHSDLDNRFRDFQHKMLVAIREGQAEFFRELAEAVKIYHEHKPYQQRIDKVRQAVLMCQANAKNAKAILSVKSVISHLRATKFPIDENTPRLVRQVRDELQIQIQGKSGRSKKGE